MEFFKNSLRAFKIFRAKWSPIHKRRPDMKIPSHTGQVYGSDDYRNIRFLNAKRIVNPKWGRILKQSQPALEVTTRTVSCGGGNFGHPIVFYNLDDGTKYCFYCGRALKRVKKPSK